MRLIDMDTKREYVPVWIDSNNNLVVITELASNNFNGVILMHPCGLGSFYKKLLSAKTEVENG